MAINQYPSNTIYVPRFGAYLSANASPTANTWNNIVFNTALSNYSSNSLINYFTASGAVITAYRAGLYLINLHVQMSAESSVGITHSVDGWVALDRMNTALGVVTINALTYMNNGNTCTMQIYPYNAGTTVTGGATATKYTVTYLGT